VDADALSAKRQTIRDLRSKVSSFGISSWHHYSQIWQDRVNGLAGGELGRVSQIAPEIGKAEFLRDKRGKNASS
jgi:hypothetical protein